MTTENSATAPDVTVKLRRDVFAELCTERGLKTTAAIAEHLGLSERTVDRVLNEDSDPSNRFIAKTLACWRRLSFRSLFAIVETKTGEERR